MVEKIETIVQEAERKLSELEKAREEIGRAITQKQEQIARIEDALRELQSLQKKLVDDESIVA